MRKVIEPCVRSPKVYEVYRKYYDEVLVEFKRESVNSDRITVTLKGERDLTRLKLSPKKITVIKPMNRSLIKKALDLGAKIIRIDTDNYSLMKKGQLNLFRQYDVIIELPLNAVNYLIVKNVASWSTRYVIDVVLSSCSEGLEVWHPLSKMALLTSLGVSEVDAFHFVFISPLRLLT
ncbi:MAG: hypothetical protein ACP5HQ_04995 [Thermoprotei archaeon]